MSLVLSSPDPPSVDALIPTRVLSVPSKAELFSCTIPTPCDAPRRQRINNARALASSSTDTTVVRRRYRSQSQTFCIVYTRVVKRAHASFCLIAHRLNQSDLILFALFKKKRLQSNTFFFIIFSGF